MKSIFILSLVTLVICNSEIVPTNNNSSRGCHGEWLEVPTHGCFLFKLDVERKWLDAQKFCEDRGGYLPEITDSDLQMTLNGMSHLLGGGKDIWTGGNDNGSEGEWRWLHSGRAIDETFWYTTDGCPRDSNEYNCISFYNARVDYRQSWCDYSCDNKFHIICQKPSEVN